MKPLPQPFVYRNTDMQIRTLLIDDEELARQEMRYLLADFPDVAIIGEAADVRDALYKIRRFQPDLIFLDINMPGQSGFDLLAQLDESPRVVFVTAYDEYALRAFETNALDYLLKPVRSDRLQKALEHVRETMLDTDSPQSGDGVHIQPGQLRPERLGIHKRRRTMLFCKAIRYFSVGKRG